MRGVGALVETPSLYPHLTGRENLEVTRRILKLSKSRIEEVLALSGLIADANRVVRDYSLGMRQRLGLALAWLGKPALIVLDEPANGLDPAGIRELRANLQELVHDHHVTIFLSSHVLNEVEQMADWIGIINRGQLLFQGKLEELQRYQVPLTVVADRGFDASALLKAKGWRVLKDSDNLLEVEVSLDADIVAINRCLLDSGIHVYRLERRQEALEDLFLRMTLN